MDENIEEKEERARIRQADLEKYLSDIDIWDQPQINIRKGASMALVAVAATPEEDEEFSEVSDIIETELRGKFKDLDELEAETDVIVTEIMVGPGMLLPTYIPEISE